MVEMVQSDKHYDLFSFPNGHNLFWVKCPHIWNTHEHPVPFQCQRTFWKEIWVVFSAVCDGQAFINLFYSSSPLFQFPGKKPLVGRNVRAITVSVPLLPCVNALPSKSTASLCIYCVRRWVSFFPPLFHGWNLSAFWELSDMVMDCWWAQNERLNERTGWERERTWNWETVRTWTCVYECERRQRVFSIGSSRGHSFTFFRPSCSVSLPPFLIFRGA